MTTTTSRRIRRRLISSFIGIIIFLISGITFQTIRDQYVIEDGGIFVPVNFINQSKIIYEAIINNAELNEILIFPCGELEKSFLREKIADFDQLSIDDAEKKLNLLWSVYFKNNPHKSCKSFPEIIQSGYRLKDAVAKDPKTPVEKQARQLYSQNLNWNVNSFCLYGKDQNGSFLLSGHPKDCENTSFRDFENNPTRGALQKNIAPLLNLAKNRLSESKNVESQSNNLTLTIDPSLQLLADKISNCAKADHNCSANLLTEIADIEYFTFTVIDANTRAILAIGCYGYPCQISNNSSIGFLAGANIEVPPASTEKLIFSYALAKSKNIEPSQLEFQIKTSGQIDGNVSKRNEWWEKQAICDSKLQKTSCPIPLETLEFAKKIGWNRNCSSEPNTSCGSSNILAPLGIKSFSPLSGRILLTSDKKGVFLNEKMLSGPFLEWKEYDSIRQGKSQPSNYKKLESTSLLVQSVIGAGNNRVSSLGLAMLSSGLYQSANFGKITEVSLFTGPDLAEKENTSSSLAGKVVLNGMQKVVMPAEKGWSGDGTANAAFRFAFDRTCSENCPIYAKTGTVTYQDRVYGGTTLFASTVNIGELSKQLNVNQNTTDKRIYSIGLIAHPKKKVKVHQASRLGMLIIKEMANKHE